MHHFASQTSSARIATLFVVFLFLFFVFFVDNDSSGSTHASYYFADVERAYLLFFGYACVVVCAQTVNNGLIHGLHRRRVRETLFLQDFWFPFVKKDSW